MSADEVRLIRQWRVEEDLAPSAMTKRLKRNKSTIMRFLAMKSKRKVKKGSGVGVGWGWLREDHPCAVSFPSHLSPPLSSPMGRTLDAHWTPIGRPLDAHWTPIGRRKSTLKTRGHVIESSQSKNA